MNLPSPRIEDANFDDDLISNEPTTVAEKETIRGIIVIIPGIYMIEYEASDHRLHY